MKAGSSSSNISFNVLELKSVGDTLVEQAHAGYLLAYRQYKNQRRRMQGVAFQLVNVDM